MHPDLEQSRYKPDVSMYEEVLLVIKTNGPRGVGLQLMEKKEKGEVIGFFHGELFLRSEWPGFEDATPLDADVASRYAAFDNTKDVKHNRIQLEARDPHLLSFKRKDGSTLVKEVSLLSRPPVSFLCCDRGEPPTPLPPVASTGLIGCYTHD